MNRLPAPPEAWRLNDVVSRLDRLVGAMADADDMVVAATATVGEAIDASRCYFVNLDRETGEALISREWQAPPGELVSVVGAYQVDRIWTTEMWAAIEDGPVCVEDVDADPLMRFGAGRRPELGVRSFAIAPYRREGRLLASLVVTAERPRRWTGGEVRLLADVAARVWPQVERAWAEALIKEQEELLAHQARFHEAMLSTIADFAYTFDRGGRFLYANQPLLRMLGITFEQIVGKNYFDLGYPPALAAKLQAQIEHVFLSGEDVVDETTFTRPDGVDGRYEYIFRPVVAEDRTVEMVAGSTRDVTERRRLVEQSRRILESIPDAFFSLDPEWRFTYANGQTERLLDRSAESLLRRSIWDEYPGLIGSPFEQVYRSAGDDRIPSKITAFFPDHDRWYAVHAYPAEPGITVYFRNVTEEKAAEAALAASEARYQTLFESIDEGFCVIEAVETSEGAPSDYRYVVANPAFGQLTGAPDVLGKTIRELFPLESQEWFDTYDHLLRTGESMRFERGLVSQGSVLELSAFPVQDGSGRRLAVVFSDVTARRVAEERLRASEERFRTLIERSADAIQLVTPDGVIVYSSESVAAVLGYAPAEFEGRNVAALVHSDDVALIRDAIAEIVATPGGYRTLQYRARHKDGSWAWVETTLANHLATPSIGAIVGNFRNVTVRKRMERQKDDFLAVASHELKTPVASMKAFVQLLTRRFARAGDVASAEMVGRMDRQLDKLTGLISDLLDVTRIESGQLGLRPEALDVVELVREIVDQVQLTAQSHPIRVESAIAETIVADRDRTGQVLVNLLANAVKFSPDGSEVLVRATSEGAGVAVTVADVGRGIGQERQPHVFDRFYRVDGTDAGHFRGLGLGLFISAEIVRRQGGRIWVDSEEGVGSTFGFWLPLVAPTGCDATDVALATPFAKP